MSFVMVGIMIYMLQTMGLTKEIVVVSNRLVTSPCAIVADAYGYTANMAKLLSE